MLNSNKISFIDTDNVIVPKTFCTASNSFSYTASEDCMLFMYTVASALATGGNQDYYINDNWIGTNGYAGSDGGQYNSLHILLKAGQTFKINKGVVHYTVFGLIK